MALLQKRCPRVAIQLVGSCFGGRAALIAAMLPGVAATFDFYGAGVSRMRPGGGPPMLELLEQVQVRLTCIYGGVDSLTPQHDRHAMESALKKTAICTRCSDILKKMLPSTALCVKSTSALTLRPHPRVGSSRSKGN